MTRVRWSESEQAEIQPCDGAQVFVERAFAPLTNHPPGVALRAYVERSAVRMRIAFSHFYHGPMEDDTEWHEVPNHNPAPRAGPYLQRITSIFVGSAFEDEWRRGWS